MTLDEAIIHAREKAEELRKQYELYDHWDEEEEERANGCLECAREHEQLAEWLTHYQAIRQIIHEWNSDYAPINPDKKEKHSKEEYFDMILVTFEPKEADNDSKR